MSLVTFPYQQPGTVSTLASHRLTSLPHRSLKQLLSIINGGLGTSILCPWNGPRVINDYMYVNIAEMTGPKVRISNLINVIVSHCYYPCENISSAKACKFLAPIILGNDNSTPTCRRIQDRSSPLTSESSP
jgi:hypothetical protein